MLPQLISASEDAPALEALVIALLSTLFLAAAFLSVIGYQIHCVLRARQVRQGEGEAADRPDGGAELGVGEEVVCRYNTDGCLACIRCVACDLPVCTLYAEGVYCKDCIQAVSPVGVLCQYIQCRGPAERFCATCGTPVCGDHTEGDYCGNCVSVLTK